jgi:hypothetical protein
MKKRLINKYALWTVQGLLIILFLFIGGMKLTLLWETFMQSGHGPSLLRLSLRFVHMAGVLGAVGGLILVPALILVIVGSLLAFAAYDRPASACPNKFI